MIRPIIFALLLVGCSDDALPAVDAGWTPPTNGCYRDTAGDDACPSSAPFFFHCADGEVKSTCPALDGGVGGFCCPFNG